MYMKIDVSVLKEVVNIVLNRYIDNNGKWLETEQDNFWFIDMEQAVNLKKEPSSLCVGSLEEDYIALQEILANQRIANILDLDRISDLLKIISLEVENSKDKIM